MARYFYQISMCKSWKVRKFHKVFYRQIFHHTSFYYQLGLLGFYYSSIKLLTSQEGGMGMIYAKLDWNNANTVTKGTFSWNDLSLKVSLDYVFILNARGRGSNWDTLHVSSHNFLANQATVSLPTPPPVLLLAPLKVISGKKLAILQAARQY